MVFIGKRRKIVDAIWREVAAWRSRELDEGRRERPWCPCRCDFGVW
jgi:hypothetical protein